MKRSTSLPSATPLASLVLLFAPPPLGAQESAARFDAPVVLLPETEPIDGLLDFDGDGFLDAVSVWWTSGTNARFTRPLPGPR